MTTLPAPLDEPPPGRGPDLAQPNALWVAAGTALAYAAVGWLALRLAGPPGYASPLYPSAGIALATVLVFGRAALPGVLLGAFAVNTGLGWLRGQSGFSMLVLPLILGAGATLQAAVGATLVRRFVAHPVVLNAPRDIALAGLLGALLACTVSPSVATPALLASGAIVREAAASNWLTWWVGDTLGVLIGAPLVLTLIGRPAADWQPRRRTLTVPLLLALGLIGAGLAELNRIDAQRLRANFDRDADRLLSEAQARLAAPMYALHALHGVARVHGGMDREALQKAARWWLEQPIHLQAMGYSERVALKDLPAFERAARAQGLPDYRVFDRGDGRARRADGEVLALRLIEPAEGNRGALGINSLSVPAARAAALASRDSGEPAATSGFRLAQSSADETGFVIYQALYRGTPTTAAQREAAFSGAVFVTVRSDRALEGLTQPGQQYLRWCLVDTDPQAERPRLAGPTGCEAQPAAADSFFARRELTVGGRRLELRVAALDSRVPGRPREATWLLSLAGMLGAAMLGALLLTVTGQGRRTSLAVQQGTAELRREMVERTQAESALRESEARLRSILDNVPLGVMFLDPGGHLIECNPRLCEMVGRRAEDLRGVSVLDLVQPEEAERIRQMRNELLRNVEAPMLEPVRLREPGAGVLHVRVRASALRDPGGRVLRMVAVLEDITEHLQLEASERALHRAEAANRAKSEFLSRMSHELRTPLNAMIGFAQLLGLDRDPALVTHQLEWAQQIQRAGWHLLEMINETLDLARIESGAVQLTLLPVPLSPLLGACRAMLAGPAAHRGVVISERLEPGAEAVLGDATRLKQVLTNLLSNAIKYNREGGRVTISARLLSGGERIEISVADTGLGMSPSQLDELFQPYNRLGREGSGIEGTGIGLVISRRLTELMGGTLEVNSEAGTGSIFLLQLPAALAAEMPVVRYTDTTPAPYQQRLVHYVEDNETNIEVMRGIFAQRPQVRLETSMLGLDGLAAVRTRRPDLILLDMQLPDISGLELLRHLKQDDEVAGIPVVVVSADATPMHIEQALTSGALHYLTKPLEVARFLRIIDAILEDVETRFGL
jgi:PAS domain S-box-containing protein